MSILLQQSYYLQDLQWLEKFIHFRCRQVFDDTFEEALEAIPSWEIAQNPPTPYYVFLQNFAHEECIVIITLLANQIYPALWDTFGKAFEEQGLEPAKMKHLGLGQLKGTPYLQATFSTILFLLGGAKVQQQTKVWELFAPKAPLSIAGILEWPSAESTPFLNTILRLNASTFYQLMTNQADHPQYSPDFPATEFTTTKTWDDLIIDQKTGTLIDQARKWVVHYNNIRTQHNRENMKGYRLLMSGPSGVGKSFTAALLGKEAGKPIYRIDISNIVDKYVGETSKKLQRIFETAEAQDWILFFDEGDALFGKRSSGGGQSNERYANQEVSYLLYKLEEYEGMIFLATNKGTAIDEAFERRFDSLIEFRKPDEYTRQQLWHYFFDKPGILELAPEINQSNWRELANKGKVSGAWIEQFYQYCLMQASAKGSNQITPAEMRQYIQWYSWERGYFNMAHQDLFHRKH